MTKLNRVLTKESSTEKCKQESEDARHRTFQENQCGAVVEQKNVILEDVGSSPGVAPFDFDSFVGKLSES